MKIPEIISGRSHRAVVHLRKYYSDRLQLSPGDDHRLYTGAYFDRWPTDGPDPAPDAFNAEDLVAVGYLSVPIHPEAALEILRLRSGRLSDLLRRIPVDVDLGDVPEGVISPGWPALQLEKELRDLRGIGAVRATKLIARKRPRLYPIYDSVVASQVGTGNRILQPLHTALRSVGGFVGNLRELREAAGLPDTISDIRVFDVITWMEGKSGAAADTTGKSDLEDPD